MKKLNAMLFAVLDRTLRRRCEENKQAKLEIQCKPKIEPPRIEEIRSCSKRTQCIPPTRKFKARGFTQTECDFQVMKCDVRREFVSVVKDYRTDFTRVTFRGNNCHPEYRKPGFGLARITSIIVISSMLATAATAATLSIGDRVAATATVNVRSTPAGTSVGQHFAGDLGTIVAGPTNATYAGTMYSWWQVSWDTVPTTGWSIQDAIAQASRPGAFTLNNLAPVCDPAPPAGPAVTLNWTVSANAATYTVKRNGVVIAQGITGTTFYNSLNLVAGQTYSYVVTAVNATGTTDSQTLAIVIPLGICTPAQPVSAILSTVSTTPSSAPADGTTSVVVTVILRDVNGNPVAGKTVNIYAGTAPVNISQPTSATDANGQAKGTITSTTACTASVWAIDRSDVLLLQQEATVQFISTLVRPNADLSQAIAMLYESSANNLVDGTLSISTVGARAGAYGDSFRAQFTEDKAAGILDAVLGIVGLAGAAGDSVKAAELLALPGVEETGTGPLITDSALATHLLDTELLQGQISGRVLKSGLLQVAAVARDEVVSQVSDFDLQAGLNYIAAQPNGLSTIALKNSLNCLTFQEALQQRELSLVNQGIPMLTAAQQTAWANDLQLRYGVGTAFLGVLSHEKEFLDQFSLARQQSSENALEWLLAKFAVEAAATVFFDGPGALVTGGIFTITDENTALQNMSADQAGYNAAFSVVGGCLQYAGQTYLDAATAFTEISQGQLASPVTAQIGLMTDSEAGYQVWAPLHLSSKFSVTKAFSSLYLTNTSAGNATFEVIVLSGYSSSAYGVNIPNLSQVTLGVLTIPAGAYAPAPITYYDGQSGGKPDPSTPMSVYVLGNNRSGTFYVGGFNHIWNPSTGAMGAVRPLDVQPEIENPVSSYITPNPSNQTYQARIFVVNPFDKTYSAIVTQAVPAGMTVLTTDGTVYNSSIVWTNTVVPGALAKEFFTFSLAVVPGASTNLSAPTAIFVDATNNPSATLSSVAPGFNGAFPVEVTGLVPIGSAGVDVTMQVGVTNLTTVYQAGSITISLMDSTATRVTNYTQTFSVPGSAGTYLSFTLSGTFPAGSYSLTGSLNINGGTSQVLAGVYVVRPTPVTLSPGPARSRSGTGFSLSLDGPLGSYLVEAKTNLADSFNWQPLRFLLITNAPFEFNDLTVTNYTSRFYRAVKQ